MNVARSAALVAPPGPGSVVGKFTLVREIGSGGMCVVFEARHEALHKTFAVKTMRPEFASQPALVERFLREGRAASRVRHRHAIDMIDVGSQDGVVYLAMEYLEGEDLARRLRREGKLAVETAVDLLIPAMAAVIEAHEAGVVHRDLKPANLFLATTRRGQIEPKVLDFGISKFLDDRDSQRQTATEALLGTPCYMAPEQVRSARSSTPASDQYALGVILYECVTGEVPFAGSTVFETFEQIVYGAFSPPRALAPWVPAELESVIVRAMSRDPAQRFASVAEMGAAMLPFASPMVRATWSSTFGPPPRELIETPSVKAQRRSQGTLTVASRALLRSAPRAALPTWERALLAVLAATLTLGLTALALEHLRSERRDAPRVVTRLQTTERALRVAAPVSPIVRAAPPVIRVVPIPARDAGLAVRRAAPPRRRVIRPPPAEPVTAPAPTTDVIGRDPTGALVVP